MTEPKTKRKPTQSPTPFTLGFTGGATIDPEAEQYYTERGHTIYKGQKAIHHLEECAAHFAPKNVRVADCTKPVTQKQIDLVLKSWKAQQRVLNKQRKEEERQAKLQAKLKGKV